MMDFTEELLREMERNAEEARIEKEFNWRSRRGNRIAQKEKAKRHLEKVYPFTGSVRKTRNGALIKKGNTFTWIPVWKKLDRRVSRYKGKEICRKEMIA